MSIITQAYVFGTQMKIFKMKSESFLPLQS